VTTARREHLAEARAPDAKPMARFTRSSARSGPTITIIHATRPLARL